MTRPEKDPQLTNKVAKGNGARATARTHFIAFLLLQQSEFETLVRNFLSVLTMVFSLSSNWLAHLTSQRVHIEFFSPARKYQSIHVSHNGTQILRQNRMSHFHVADIVKTLIFGLQATRFLV